MTYEKFTPAPELAPFVQCYFHWHSSGEAVTDFTVESPPTGFCSLVFNEGCDYVLRNKKYENLQVPRQFISGQSIYSYSLHFNGIINICGIVFKPAALATIFDFPTFEFTEERIPLDTLFRKSTVDELAAALAEENSSNGKMKLLEGFMLQAYHRNKPEGDYVDNAANLILEKYGLLDVGEIMKNVFMSRRNFERRFFRKVGLSPKYYARIIRMSYVMNMIAGKKKADWGALFSECEFYDQSHFIKDFLEFTGRTPQQYIDGNRELANWVDKPKSNTIQY